MFNSSYLHPQLVTMLDHYLSIRAIPFQVVTGELADFIIEAARPCTPLEVSATILRRVIEAMATTSMHVEALSVDPRTLLVNARSTWYRERAAKWQAACDRYAATGDQRVLDAVPIEERGPWPRDNDILTAYPTAVDGTEGDSAVEFNAHEKEYLAYNIKCPCLHCLEDRFGTIQLESDLAK